MHESTDELARLQRTLDESYALGGEHLRSIFTPERRMSAEQISRVGVRHPVRNSFRFYRFIRILDQFQFGTVRTEARES